MGKMFAVKALRLSIQIFSIKFDLDSCHIKMYNLA